MADGTLLATPHPDADLIPSILTLSDVMCTGWHAAVSAGVGPGKSVAVVGDGAVGLCAVLAPIQLGAETVIAMGRHEIAGDVAAVGATHIVAERGDDGVGRRRAHRRHGADCVLECVGTSPGCRPSAASAPAATSASSGSRTANCRSTHLFWRNVGITGGPAAAGLPDRALELVLTGKINPGIVFDLELPLSEVAEAYAAWTSGGRSSRCCAPDNGGDPPTIPPRGATRIAMRRWHHRTAQGPRQLFGDQVSTLSEPTRAGGVLRQLRVRRVIRRLEPRPPAPGDGAARRTDRCQGLGEYGSWSAPL